MLEVNQKLNWAPSTDSSNEGGKKGSKPNKKIVIKAGPSVDCAIRNLMLHEGQRPRCQWSASVNWSATVEALILSHWTGSGWWWAGWKLPNTGLTESSSITSFTAQRDTSSGPAGGTCRSCLCSSEPGLHSFKSTLTIGCVLQSIGHHLLVLALPVFLYVWCHQWATTHIVEEEIISHPYKKCHCC